MPCQKCEKRFEECVTCNMQRRGEDAHQPAYPCSQISRHHAFIL